ncbi:ATP-binding protein [Actinoplanes sp. NPDC049668]|uniref:hybrid sensor histidine kinase/response regulator n=1 Tax=unclassified Actinoplanes TaxID=2626549 RepID=UPI0033B55921
MLRTRQWRNNPLGLATAAIFFSCAVHHGAHTVHLMLPYLDPTMHMGLAMRHAFSSPSIASWDVVTAGLAVWYWTLRGRFPALVRGAAVFEDLRLRQAAEATLRASEERYRGIVETTSEGVLLLDGEGRITYANNRFAAMLGRPQDELSGAAFMNLVTEADRQLAERELAGVAEGGTRRLELGLHRSGGEVMCAMVALTAGVDDDGGVLAMVADVTAQKNIEAQLRQAQKLDAVGQLAGGVAHDFNNLLTVIDGYAALLIARADEASARDLTMIREAATRAGTLTRQLLAFSRTQTAEERVVDVVGLVKGLEGMLHRLIREDIEMVVTAVTAPLHVRVDPGQLEQVLVNLVVNARDAMPDGGTLTIGTDRVEVDGEAAAQLGAQPGENVRITVADGGCGMSAEVAARIFEPFFTTKEQGKGTGLGMSTVYGIVTQAGGSIQVNSRPGQGTAVEVYLPMSAAAELPAGPPPDPVPQRLVTGTETILFIEDDPAVRTLTERILRTAGYRVLTGVDGHHALRIMEGNPEISLLVTDVIMPGMNGQQLADRITAMLPGLPVLFTSAHTRGVLTPTTRDDPGVAFLEKPYTATGITRTVRAVLDARTSSATATN